MSSDCDHNIDTLKLQREGSNQDDRYRSVLDPLQVPVDGQGIARKISFARNISSFINYFNASNTVDGDWRPFFREDVSVPLALLATQEPDQYSAEVQSYFSFLNNIDNDSLDNELKKRFSFLFSMVSSLAKQIDLIKELLPKDISLHQQIQNLVTIRLAP